MHFLFLFYSKFIFSRTTYGELKLLVLWKENRKYFCFANCCFKSHFFLRKARNIISNMKHVSFNFFSSFNKYSLVEWLGNILTQVWQVTWKCSILFIFCKMFLFARNFTCFIPTWFNRKEWYEKGKKKIVQWKSTDICFLKKYYT